jgi:hypothetical protein
VKFIAIMNVELYLEVEAASPEHALEIAKHTPMDDWAGTASDIAIERRENNA